MPSDAELCKLVLKTWWHHSEQGEAKLVSKISSGVR